ncbi:hypothetical protein C8J56DRAFT_940776 [Mycena floridula]|nr:hypothetical protein C8J56DRAFT_940776 [Mycena floridula]
MADFPFTGSCSLNGKSVVEMPCYRCSNDYLQHIPLAHVDDFPHLSRTNHVPVMAEIPAVEADILIRKEEIQALQVDIDKLRQALKALESRQSTAKEALRVQEGILHPLRRLPPELLRGIFRECMADSDFGPIRSPFTNDFPWNVTHVCQRWRAIGISFPELWTVIQQTDRYARDEPLQLMLDRSAYCPLTVSIRSSRRILNESDQIIRMLLPTSSRWRTLDMKVRHVDALMPIRGQIASLEELSITFYRLRSASDMPFAMFEVAPALRKVHLKYELYHEDFLEGGQLLLPWPTLTHYTVDSYHDDVMGQLEPLPFCVNLIELQVHVAICPILPHNTTFPNLTLLSFFTFRNGEIAQLLNKLTLPALSLLHLGLKQGWNDADQQSVGSLVSRSQCTLTSVQFEAIWRIHSSLITFLSDNPSITEVSLVGDDCEDLLPHLHYTPTSVLLPKLTVFRMTLEHGADDPEVAIEKLLDMVESRFSSAEGCARMIQVQVCNFKEHSLDASELDRLKVLRDAGLRFLIDCDPESLGSEYLDFAEP